MIHGMTNNETQSTIEKFNDSKFEFYLTGSRFVGNTHPQSDWDFFVEDSPEFRVFLTNIGFFTDSYSVYQDNSCSEVYRKGNIHVQLIRYDFMAKKIEANEIIKKVFPYLQNMDKYSMRDLWNTLME